MLPLRRLKAAGIHLVVSAAVALLAAMIIFLLWYPSPFDVVAGGTQLFVLVMSVDVVAGPALTFVVASPGKPRAELGRDLAVIAAFQLGALAYGLHTVSEARPVVVAFEVDRLRVVSAAEVDAKLLPEAPAGLRDLSWTGPRPIAAIKPTDPDQAFRSVELGLSGVDLSMDPRNWRTYASASEATWRAAKPLRLVLEKYPATRAEAEKIASDAGVPLTDLRFLPLQARRSIWTAVLAQPDARIVGYLPVDGFL